MPSQFSSRLYTENMGNTTTKFRSFKKKTKIQPEKESQDRRLEKNERFKYVHEELRRKYEEIDLNNVTNQTTEESSKKLEKRPPTPKVLLRKDLKIFNDTSEDEEVVQNSSKEIENHESLTPNVDYETRVRLIQLYKIPTPPVPVKAWNMNKLFGNTSKFGTSSRLREFFYFISYYFYFIRVLLNYLFLQFFYVSLTI